MADKKISALTAATTPLAGTEVLPIVQSGSTVKVANNDLRPKQIQSNATSGVLQVVGPAASATRVMTVPDANFTAARTDAAQSFTGDQTLGTGNLIQGTAAKGFNFTANTPAAGMTSQLLNWYEEGTWTPASGVGTATSVTGTYTRIGRQVTVTGSLVFPVQTNSNQAQITGLPFTILSTSGPAGLVRYSDYGAMFYLFGETNDTKISFYAVATGPTAVTYTNMSGKRVDFSMTYFV